MAQFLEYAGNIETKSLTAAPAKGYNVRYFDKKVNFL
jgi:hypothetical protein